MLTLDQSPDDEANKRGRLAFFALPQGTERGRSLAVGDLDGDGKKDVVVTDPANAQVWVYLQTGRSGLSSGQTFPSLGNARTVRLAPLKAVGKNEVYVLSEQEKQIGRSVFEKGRLSFPIPLSLAGEPAAMDVADLDANKSPEILYVARVKPSGDKSDKEKYELRAVTREFLRRVSAHEVGRSRVGRAPRCDGGSSRHKGPRHQPRWPDRPPGLQGLRIAPLDSR